jgi:hypothetical protein
MGENQVVDNVDIGRLRQVEFDQVEIYDPARFEGMVKINPINDRPEIDYTLHLEKSIMMLLELDPESTELSDQISIDELINFKIYKGKDGFKIELSSESDVQLYYSATYKEESFR